MPKEKKNRSYFKSATYEEFRNFLKINFYYCSLSREQQSEYLKRLGTTRYNEYKNNTEMISGGKIAFIKSNNRKAFKYDVTQFESDYNVFANSFQLKNVTALDTCLTLHILLVLVNNPMSASEITDSLTGSIDDKTITNKIKNMCEYGLISQNEGKKYFVEESFFNIIDENNLLKLLNMVDFMKNLVSPEVSGYNLFSILKHAYEERTGKEYYSPFQFKYSHLANILDDNVLWAIIEAIGERRYISFTYRKKKRENFIPIKIFTENEYNRRYLYAASSDSKRLYIFRLSEIYDLNVTGKKGSFTKTDFEKYLEAYHNEQKYSFAGKIDSSSRTETLRLKFKNNRRIRTQIKNDFKCVKFEKDNTALVTIKSKKMIKPYLRANIGLIETTDAELSGLINSEIEEMKRNYGIIQCIQE